MIFWKNVAHQTTLYTEFYNGSQFLNHVTNISMSIFLKKSKQVQFHEYEVAGTRLSETVEAKFVQMRTMDNVESREYISYSQDEYNKNRLIRIMNQSHL